MPRSFPKESDLDRSRGAVLVRCGKDGKRREVGMDRWAWSQLDPWLAIRRQLGHEKSTKLAFELA
jgi:site-specific recombinase XerC